MADNVASIPDTGVNGNARWCKISPLCFLTVGLLMLTSALLLKETGYVTWQPATGVMAHVMTTLSDGSAACSTAPHASTQHSTDQRPQAASSSVTKNVLDIISQARLSAYISERPTVVSLAGNLAAFNTSRNMLATVGRLNRPFPVMITPLDDSALEAWTAYVRSEPHACVNDAKCATNVQVNDDQTLRDHPSVTQPFREGAYNMLSLAKWTIALSLLSAGADVLIIDPDLVFLKDPLHHVFVESPVCDFTMVAETRIDYTLEKVTESGGFSLFGFTNWLNTGFVRVRRSDRIQKLLEAYHAEAHQRMQSEALDDQELLNQYITQNYDVVPHPNMSVGETIAQALINNRCIEYRAKAGDGSPAPHFSLALLHRYLFQLRLDYDEDHRSRSTLIMPYLVHYNYVVRIDEKPEYMKKNGHWIIDG